MGSFLEGHGDTLRRNRCVLGLGSSENRVKKAILAQTALGDIAFGKNSSKLEKDSNVVGHFYGSCADSHLTLEKNEYYTPDGEIVIVCESDSHHALEEMQEQFGLESGSTGGMLPCDSQILQWAEALVATNRAHDSQKSAKTKKIHFDYYIH